ncbi:MAG: putative Na+/H+ antiporter [Fibrobacterota bacterium]|nr:MAG: putative Na+/H+ antiporter [Fibrobacterota bacterium]
MTPTPLQIVALVFFVLALFHVFLASHFEKLAHRFPRHAGTLHLLGEIEVVFGFWAMLLFGAHVALSGSKAAIAHLESLNFTEPLFVFVVMVVAGTRPVLQAATAFVNGLARLIPLPGATGFAFVCLGVAPLLGSFITEPAAMTVAALLLHGRILSEGTSKRLKYAALAVLFVNVSIGGVLTSYAAPPVLMVAGTWGWDSSFMFATFGARAIPAVLINALVFTFLFRRELSSMPAPTGSSTKSVPISLILVHLAFVAAVVLASHYVVLLMGTFLFFLGFVHAYRDHHSPLLLREGLLVGFFLAGLVVIGSPQGWWLTPVLTSLGDKALYLGASGLTALVDNAALTYLGSLVPDTTDSFRYHLVAGAVVGGGLTVIANAPNPAGASILRDRFPDGVIAPGSLLLYALAPTLVAMVAFGI